MINICPKSASLNVNVKHDALSNLVRLYDQLASGHNLDQSLAEWIIVGIESLRDGTLDTLDSALGLESRPGIPKIGGRLRKHYRDLYLLDSMSLIRNPGESNWSLATRTGKEISKFKTTIWPRVSRAKNPPDRFNKFQLKLWDLFNIEPDPPVSAAFLFELLKQPPIFPEAEIANN